MKYVAFTRNGEEFSGLPQDCPDCILCIVQEDKATGCTVLKGKDYFAYHDDLGCWLDHDWEGLVNQLVVKGSQINVVRRGWHTSSLIYDEALQKAVRYGMVMSARRE